MNDCRLKLRQPLAFLSLGYSLALVVAVKVVTTQRVRAYDLAIATPPLLFPALALYRRHWKATSAWVAAWFVLLVLPWALSGLMTLEQRDAEARLMVSVACPKLVLVYRLLRHR